MDSDIKVEELASRIEKLFIALCDYVGLDAEDRTPETYIKSGLGATEYAVVVAKKLGISKENFLKVATTIWDEIHIPAEPTGEEGQVLSEDSSPPV